MIFRSFWIVSWLVFLNVSPWNSLSRLIPVDSLDDSNPLDLDMIIEKFSCLMSLRTIESAMIESLAF
jgi:hypothetical protein